MHKILHIAKNINLFLNFYEITYCTKKNELRIEIHNKK